MLLVPLPGVELSIPAQLPLPGAATTQLKVLAQHADARSATWLLEAQGGAEYMLPVRLNGVSNIRVQGADLVEGLPSVSTAPLAGDALVPVEPSLKTNQALRIRFPAGAGYVRQTVTARW